MGLKRKITLRAIFIRYILYFSFGTILLVFLDLSLYFIMINNNMLLPANYSEKQLESNRKVISKVDVVKENMIPNGCSYGVFDKSGKMLYGNFTVKQSENAWEAFVTNKVNPNGRHYFKQPRGNNEVCVVQYFLTMQFNNPMLSKYFKSPEICMILLFIFIFAGEVLFISNKFKKCFLKEMKRLTKAAENIKKQNLDFQPEHSNICEIEEVIDSLNEMKIALKESLEKQWNMEKGRKNQISAVAHDIKTPLTIIKGNAELINETCQQEENIKYNNYIIKSANEIEHYIKVLIDMTKSEDALVLKPAKIETKIFFKRLEEQVKALAGEKNLQVIAELKKVPEFFYADEELLYRAIMNVISNAVEYSPENGNILFKVEESEKAMQFSVIDSGKGFSKEELEFAQEQFYRGDSSRNSKNHYGIGLYISTSFIKLHKGNIKISNSQETGGAQVVLEIP